MMSVEIRSITKAWGATRALDDVSFVVEKGELVVLLGPSGCGKSTMLRLIAGLDEPRSGRIEIEGRDVAGLTGSARGVAMVFQSYALFPHLSVADNITFGLSVRGVSKQETGQRLDKIAELLGLEPLLRRKPGQLSGGQQQRVALGRALIAEAPVCLLDEPLSNLDAQLRQDLRHEIRALQQRLGITMVYVTHDQTEAMSMADRVILMRAGKIEQNGTPADLYERPATMFTARFIGGAPMTMLDLDDGKAGAVIAGTQSLIMPNAPGRGRVLGLRPEDVAIDSGGLRAQIHAVVTAVEYLGAEALVSCQLGDRTILARSRGAAAPSVGAKVGLFWEPMAAHVFDAASGQRLAGATPASAFHPSTQRQGSITA
ncbi:MULTISPECIES: ABC transporter ATP-binding protein [Rhodopseudomonas]|uniref:ABC transporter ATP-binding protein n=1 Tax=Rhodopseudomonas TaxID=1073 RepID=UPI0009BAB162|nr:MULTISPECIES: ABC transporter ATP-binding protein [Rhodopseudomonas]MDF3813605.1 ABC transporter ATP-binding protein [Rhodopseudomonas sp. BAL398]WOK17007.1 ABC transporter ATP-binding protein [Rhodopseudomonas sp. BAL398]